MKHAFQILWAFGLEEPALGVNELSRRLGLHKSTVSRLLATLEEQRLVRQDPATGKYHLGVGIVELAGIVLNDLDLRHVAAPHLRQLWAATRENVNLGVWDQGQVLMIEHLSSPERIKYLGWVGAREPAHCTSMGKVMLAYSEPEIVESVIRAGLVAYTPRTIVDRGRLLQELEAIRRRGYSINEGESHEGLSAVAAAIWRYPHDLAGAVAVAGPSFRFTAEQVTQFGRMVVQTAAEISRQLGATPTQAVADARALVEPAVTPPAETPPV